MSDPALQRVETALSDLAAAVAAIPRRAAYAMPAYVAGRTLLAIHKRAALLAAFKQQAHDVSSAAE